MHRYEAGGIFFARLLPVIRHLISIPAGIIRMSFLKFSILTTVGAAIWCSVLAWLGGKIGRQSGENPLQNPDALVHAVKAESHWIIAVVLLVCVLYFVAMKLSGAAEKATD
jgi:membrane protein DedA with SNARE-associated domain